MTDPREEILDRWEEVAAGWKATREAFQRTALPVSERMVEAIHPQPGHRVLELAAGLGDTGLLAAERVRPGGSVIITDGANAMVAAAAEHVAQVGADDIEVRQMQAEWIDLPTASVDGVLCRFGYMLLVDPEAALRETRRVLKPGGRVAFAVWDALERNPWVGVMRRAMEEQGLAATPPPGAPGQFALSSVPELEELLDATGFDDAEFSPVDLVFEAASLDEWWDVSIQTSSNLAAAVSALSPAEHYKLRDAVDAGYAEYVRDDGSVQLPARALVAEASA
jgi:SAM-dependent methyltransferase